MANKNQKTKTVLKGMGKHISGHYKKESKEILNKLDELDKKAEITPLQPVEIDLKHVLNERLAELLREEELKWYQRAKVKNLLVGDANTNFFHLVANGKHRKTHIFQLEDGERIICGDAQLKSFITTYYKQLFGPSVEMNVSLDESRTEDIPQVSELENKHLTQ